MNVRALDQQAYCLTEKSFLSPNFLFNSMMLHTKSKFADPAVNFSQILPIWWFCEVFYQNNIDTKNDVGMYRCFPVINTLLWLWLILLTSFLYLCPSKGFLVGREGMRSAKTKLLQTIICLWKNARKCNIVPTSLTGKISKVQLSFYLVFLFLICWFSIKSQVWKNCSYSRLG